MVDLANGLSRVLDRGEQVLALRLEEPEPFLGLLKIFKRRHIHRAQALDALLDLADFLLRRSQRFTRKRSVLRELLKELVGLKARLSARARRWLRSDSARIRFSRSAERSSRALSSAARSASMEDKI